MTDHEMDIAVIKSKLDDMESRSYARVTREEFEPVRKLVFGLVFIILMMVVMSMLALMLPPDWWRPIVRMFK